VQIGKGHPGKSAAIRTERKIINRKMNYEVLEKEAATTGNLREARNRGDRLSLEKEGRGEGCSNAGESSESRENSSEAPGRGGGLSTLVNSSESEKESSRATKKRVDQSAACGKVASE